ncbi:MAG: SDR family NAD(P)-dependent oxidoreductase [Acidimicrobiales bacterium]
MRSATGSLQSVLVLGGRSEIAHAILGALDPARLERVVTASRPGGSDRAHPAPVPTSATIEHLDYDATDPQAHQRVVAAAAEPGDLDLIIVAFGRLGDPFDLEADPATTADLVDLNGAAACAAAHAAVRRLTEQGHGTLVVLSSVAAQRVRRENAPYAAGKAALDAYTRALIDMTHGTAVRVVLVRPGFVRGRMTEGRPAAPLATTPSAVARDVVAAIGDDRSAIVWSPGSLRAVMAGLVAAPGFLWRRLTR